MTLKLWVLFQVSYLAFLGPFTQAVINSAFVPMAKSLHLSVTTASYATTIAIIGAGVTPLLLSPISNVYGRRPVFILVTAIGIIAHCSSAAAPSWRGILAARFFVGVGTSAGMGIGAACVADMFFMHERGRYMGVYTVFVTNGAHVAGMVGGPIAKYLGWRWCFWIPGIVLGITWLVNLIALPETLYHRNNATGQTFQANTTWLKLFTFNASAVKRRLTLWDFTHVFVMLKYPSILFPALYYSVAFSIGSVLFAVTGAAAFGSIYHFVSRQVLPLLTTFPADTCQDTVGIGLCIGLPTFIGTLIGEAFGGSVSDRMLYLYAKAHGGDERPEARLHATWLGAFLLPAGVIIEGVTLQYLSLIHI